MARRLNSARARNWRLPSLLPSLLCHRTRSLTHRRSRSAFCLRSSQLQPALDLTVVDVSFGNRLLLWRGATAATELNRGAAVMHKATKWREHFQWALCQVHGEGAYTYRHADGGSGGTGGSGGGGSPLLKDTAGGKVGGEVELFDDAMTLRCSGGGVETWPAGARCGACGCLSTRLAEKLKRKQKQKARAAKLRAKPAHGGTANVAEALRGAAAATSPEDITPSPLLAPNHPCAINTACASYFGGNQSGFFSRVAMCHVTSRRRVPRVSLGRRPWLCAANESDVLAACDAPAAR